MRKLIVVVGLLLCACASIALSQSGGGPGNKWQVQNAPSVTISGNALLKNGSVWAPKGASIYGFTIAPNQVTSEFLTYQSYYPQELYYIRTQLNGDTIRFTVAQCALDPQSSNFDPTYAPQLDRVVKQATSLGFFVILSPDSQTYTGCTDTCMPGADTIRAWQTLIPYFANNPWVWFGLFNEPCDDTSSGSQAIWVTDTNAVITAVRATGANNLLVIGGLQLAKYTTGLGSQVIDPLNYWVFGVHPYFQAGFVNSTEWAAYFGVDSATYPTIVDEWTSTPEIHCQSPTAPASMIAFLKTVGASKGTGVLGFGPDLAADLFIDQTSWALTNTNSWVLCTPDGVSGPGQLISAY